MTKKPKEKLYTGAQYEKTFNRASNVGSQESKKAYAFRVALDNRKFEIDLYWRRATYFWTFIAAALAGYIIVQSSNVQSKDEISLLLTCLGATFSIAWFLANRGSKQWQENWENHVDMLEDDLVGPLYKTVLYRPEPYKLKDRVERMIVGPSKISVSKINQILSLYITLLWLILLCFIVFPLNTGADISIKKLSIVVLSIITWIGFFWYGRTHKGGHQHKGVERISKFYEEE